ncbi:MAG TPA: hypothetical protein DCM87_01640 [Planctomycetes bacterium]|nr:hypothetical protein [Planctomycetota bacterium]
MTERTVADHDRGAMPAVILAGSDRRPGPVPPGARAHDFLVGYKGAEIEIGGRPLVQLVRERLIESGCFSAVLVAGPMRLYEPIAPGAVIDTDRDLGHNLRCVFAACKRSERLCIASCDIVPEAADVRAAIDLWRTTGGADFWVPLIEVPPDLGASAWKPKYGIKPGPGEPAQQYLPGHLGVLGLRAVRTGFLCKMIALIYRLRNRELEHRRKVIFGLVVGDLLGQDLLNLFRLRLPTMTWTVLKTGWRLYSRLRKGQLSLADMENALTELLIRGRSRRRGAVRFTPCSLASLARDLDTVGEVAEHGGRWQGRLAAWE